MNERTQDRLFAASGIAFVVLVMAGALVAMAGGKTHDLTVSSTTGKIAAALAQPASTATWVGAYLELLSFGAFLCFAVWACEKLGGGVWGAIGRSAATAVAAVSVTSLGLMNAISWRAGHGIDPALGKTLVTVNESVYVGTWFLTAFFLVAVGALALQAGRRALGWSAMAIVAYTLVVTPLSVDNLGQFSGMLFFVWVICASIALARRGSRRAPVPVTA